MVDVQSIQQLGATGGLILVALALVELIKKKTNGRVAEEIKVLAGQIRLLQARVDRLVDVFKLREQTGPFMTQSEPTLKIKIDTSTATVDNTKKRPGI